MIHYERELNAAQLEAVKATEGPVLVIAGAGSGKTRTIVYRLAYLVENGVSPEEILLLTFTRKAAQEMLLRAGDLLGVGLGRVGGGTFHSFAYATLMRWSRVLAGPEGPVPTVMDSADARELLGRAKDETGAGKGDRKFPKRNTVQGLISRARNKELSIGDVVRDDSPHLMPYVDDLEKMSAAYAALKRRGFLLDYDDLLFQLEALIRDNEAVRNDLRNRFRYVMVDEFQDTNKVQARIVKLIAGDGGNIMAVGDDAQSIYAFRGADVENILRFEKDFPGARIISLEQNYRSTQPILDLTNEILARAERKYEKNLFTEKNDGASPEVFKLLSDATQAKAVVGKVVELSKKYRMHEIAILFRAGFHSFPIEVALNKLGVKFQKFGGIKFTDAAHVKDAVAYLRLLRNRADLPSWRRVLGHVKRVGVKTADKMYQAVVTGDAGAVGKFQKKFPGFDEIMTLLARLNPNARADSLLEEVIAFYSPILIEAFPDDYPKRQQGLDQLVKIASMYENLTDFLADVSLENPEEESRGLAEDTLVLSTIHSAKGLEYKAVLIIDLVEDRFPGRKAMTRPEDMEEERRLMYVACTRAMRYLALFVPRTVQGRGGGMSEAVLPSPFVAELPMDMYRELSENYSGGFDTLKPRNKKYVAIGQDSDSIDSNGGSGAASGPKKLGFCNHKIYGRGKIVKAMPGEKYQVNFPGFGLKTIVGQFLEFE